MGCREVGAEWGVDEHGAAELKAADEATGWNLFPLRKHNVAVGYCFVVHQDLFWVSGVQNEIDGKESEWARNAQWVLRHGLFLGRMAKQR